MTQKADPVSQNALSVSQEVSGVTQNSVRDGRDANLSAEAIPLNKEHESDTSEGCGSVNDDYNDPFEDDPEDPLGWRN